MPSDTHVNDAIAALSHQFGDNFSNGDFAALAAMFSEDAVVLPPGTNVVSGRENIRSFWRQARRIQSLSLEPSSVKSLGDGGAREAGVMVIGMRASQRGREREVRGKYVLVWHLEDGDWLIDSAMWNMNAAGGRRQGGGQGGRQGQGAGGGRVAGNRQNRAAGGGGSGGGGPNRGGGGGGGQNRGGGGGGGGPNRGGGGPNRVGGGAGRGDQNQGAGGQRAAFVSRVG
jgi:uncharacterized protein (TIGR02246 family)